MIAFYTAGAMVINSETYRQVLPLGRPLFQLAAPPAPTPTVVERPVVQRREGTSGTACRAIRQGRLAPIHGSVAGWLALLPPLVQFGAEALAVWGGLRLPIARSANHGHCGTVAADILGQDISANVD